MVIYIALDDKNGMMFNRRRQSKDRVLREDMLNDIGENKLWFNEYTAKQFEEVLPANAVVDNNFLDKAEKNDGCFVENMALAEYTGKIEKFVLYKWNRVYPADMYFDIDLSAAGWKQESISEFAGSSHEKITKEVWLREV
ncbi:MAG: ribonuclease Z [Lachnospiraceae bacterium]|nr:ribonuclease Z [Lachnospiraceae bacterium]